MKTQQRKIIVSYLKNNTSHPTAREIYEAVSQKSGIVSLATVYNTLSLLKKTGLVREINIKNFAQRYDPNITPHAHLICGSCGEIADVHYPIHVGVPAEHRQGFTVKSSEVNFYGLCPLCAERDKRTSSKRRS